MTLQELAKIALGCFELRDMKKKSKVYSLKRNSPDWVIELVYDAVPEIVANDFIFKNVFTLLELIAQGKEGEEIYLAPDENLESQVAWLLGHKYRRLYVSDILNQNCRNDIEEVLRISQKLELESIQESVFSILELELKQIKKREDDKNEFGKC